MSLLDKATIITTPTAHSEGVLHSVKGGSVADFDVVRGSVATRVNAEGLIEDVATDIPRIDYTDGTASILLEPQSTNLIEYSEDFSQSYWNTFGGETTRTLDSTMTNPIGGLGAYIVEGVSNLRRFGLVQAVTTNTDYTLSFYAKNIDATLLKTTITNSSVSSYTFTSEVNSTDWTRVEINFTSLTGANCIIQVVRDLPVGQSAYIWGAFLVELPYATSYIPTNGAIATRLADSVTGAGDATTFNSTEGVLYAEMAALANDLTSRCISINKDTSERVVIRYSLVSNQVQAFTTAGATTQANITHALTNQTDLIKIAFKYKENDFSLWVNGVEVGTDTSGSVSVADSFDNLTLDQGNGAQNFYGKVKSVITFDTALTDAELECLTTI